MKRYSQKHIYLEDELMERVELWRAKQRPIPRFSTAIQALLKEALDKEDASDPEGRATTGKREGGETR